MRAVLRRGDFWELRCAALQADITIARLKADAERIATARDAVFARMATRYGFEAARPFTLEEDDYSLTQDERGKGPHP